MWRVINTNEVGGITSDNLGVSMGSKNRDADVFALGFVVTLTFLKSDGEGSVSFLVCIVEFIHVCHTDKGTLKTVLTSFIGAHITHI